MTRNTEELIFPSTGAFNTGRQSRLDQLVSWCGGTDFDGCVIFDECHKAKNFVPVSVTDIFPSTVAGRQCFRNTELETIPAKF